MQDSSSPQQPGGSHTDPRTESISSPGSGESSKENGLGEDQVAPPTLCSLSPVRPNRRFPNVLSVRQDEMQILMTSDLHDPAMSPGNPDCGHRWSLNSPPAGLLHKISAGFAAVDQPIHTGPEVDNIGGHDVESVPPGHVPATIDKHHTGAAAFGDTPPPVPTLQGCCAPRCSTPIRVTPQRSFDQDQAVRCRSVHVTHSPCQAKSLRANLSCPSPVHVMPWRVDQHVACITRSPESMIGWGFQMPDRTPFTVQSRRLHAAMSDLDKAAKALSWETSNIASLHNEYCCSQEMQGEGAPRSGFDRIRHGFDMLFRLFKWSNLVYPHFWGGIILALRTADVPEQSWILLAVFSALTVIAWCGHMCMQQSVPCGCPIAALMQCVMSTGSGIVY